MNKIALKKNQKTKEFKDWHSESENTLQVIKGLGKTYLWESK